MLEGWLLALEEGLGTHEEREKEDGFAVGGERGAEQRLPALLEERSIAVDAVDGFQGRGDLGEHLVRQWRDDSNGWEEV